MLFIFGGLPGTGKSTIARELGRRTGATYLRLDSVEQAIRSSGILPPTVGVGPAGYIAVYRLAADNLRLGQSVIADTVNPVHATRTAFRNVAAETGARFMEIEVFCSDAAVHRHRAETRGTDIEGHVPPTWKEIMDREVEPWSDPAVHLDTARLPVAQSVEAILSAMADRLS
ncbi:AAA family ATPase [Rhizobiaceae bacterium BDR2-2]|uniref:AAA family ATPase n=1 Tax=Ectorhizobium quercum TaxID=2965071 RepID=A0AAE3SWL2_9HYPH|nr:AAA family ATPase [Ectorhizobium quercum]MCX8999515.1 AAA family ATPase [Ectorhizobium quercum]